MSGDELAVFKTLSSFGGWAAVATALTFILYRVTSRIVERMIAAIDRVAMKVDTLDEREASRHAAIREDIIKLDAKVTSDSDWRNRRRPSREYPIVDEEGNTRTPTNVRRERDRDR